MAKLKESERGEKQKKNTTNIKEIVATLAAQKEGGSPVTADDLSQYFVDLLNARQPIPIDYTAYAPSENAVNGYSPTLIYDNGDPDNPIAVWAFAFKEEARTCKHDHPGECFFTTLNGQITESTYKPLKSGGHYITGEDGKPYVQTIGKVKRAPGSYGLDLANSEPGEQNVHQLRVTAEDTAVNKENAEYPYVVNVHIYRIPIDQKRCKDQFVKVPKESGWHKCRTERDEMIRSGTWLGYVEERDKALSKNQPPVHGG